jgi:CheY-like chemotaxis protein
VGQVSALRIPMKLGEADGGPLIVVADRDADVRETVRDFMSARGYRVEQAGDAESAASMLASGRIDVLISELALRGADGTDLLALARTAAPSTRRIAIAADATVRDRDAALRLGALRVLAKPLSLLELADAISLAHDSAEGFHGSLHRMSLIDVLQMYHHTGQSLVIQVRGDVEGSIALRHGELIHAESGDRTGMPALTELLAVPRGWLETSALDRTARTIAGAFDHVLLDGLRALDERRRPARPSAPPAISGVLSGLPGGAGALSGGMSGGMSGGPAGASGDVSGSFALSWFDDPVERSPLDREALQRWLAEHAPGAGVWRFDPATAELERLDPPSAHPEHDLAGAPGSLGWAFELAELADPSWTRVELIAGGTAVALIRAAGVSLAFARLVPGDAMLRRFQVESARLVRWLTDHVVDAAAASATSAAAASATSAAAASATSAAAASATSAAAASATSAAAASATSAAAASATSAAAASTEGAA